jgi:hypothetical protein
MPRAVGPRAARVDAAGEVPESLVAAGVGGVVDRRGGEIVEADLVAAARADA